MQIILANFKKYTISIDANTSIKIGHYLIKKYLEEPSLELKKYLALPEEDMKQKVMKELGKKEECHIEDDEDHNNDQQCNPYLNFIWQDKIEKLFNSKNDRNENEKKIVGITDEMSANFTKVADLVTFKYYQHCKNIKRDKLIGVVFKWGYKSSEIETVTSATAKAIMKELKMLLRIVEKLTRETSKLQHDKQLKELQVEKEKLYKLIKKIKKAS